MKPVLERVNTENGGFILRMWISKYLYIFNKNNSSAKSKKGKYMYKIIIYKKIYMTQQKQNDEKYTISAGPFVSSRQ